MYAFECFRFTWRYVEKPRRLQLVELASARITVTVAVGSCMIRGGIIMGGHGEE